MGRRRPKWDDFDRTLIAEMWGRRTLEQIADTLGKTTQSVKLFAALNGLKAPDKVSRAPSYKKCTGEIWFDTGIEAARAAGISPAKLFSGVQAPGITQVRWQAWRKLVDSGYSMNTVAQASGFNHTSILHGVNRLKEREAA